MPDSMKYIILDTSSILFGLSNNSNVLQAVKESLPDYKILVSNGIINELKKIGSGRRKSKGNAKVALSMLKMGGIEISEEKAEVDSWIMKEAVSKGYSVCTNDIKLKSALKAKGVRTFSITRSGLLR